LREGSAVRSARLRAVAMIVVLATTVGGGLTRAETAVDALRFDAAQAQEKLVGEGEGVVDRVNADERQIMITHGPISGTLTMSSMTMAFGVTPDVDLSGLARGAKVKFRVTRDAKGRYVIDQIHPEN